MKISIVLRRGNKIKLRIVTRIHVKWIKHVCFITTIFGRWLNEVVDEFSVGREMTILGGFYGGEYVLGEELVGEALDWGLW